MPFASALRESLEIRRSLLSSEFIRGDSLERVLARHLSTVEQNFDGELITSVLLLSADGRRLSHAAGPNVPLEYRLAVDGSEIGPCAGSCGTAAFFGHPVYVSDIATDPLWADYRELALPHGFKSCWSTPIRDESGSVVGTFAIYHRTAREPSAEEIEAIGMITEHVARAIVLARGVQDLDEIPKAPRLRLVSDDSDGDLVGRWPSRLLARVERLEELAAELDRQAEHEDSDEARENLRSAATDSRSLISAIRQRIENAG